MFKVKPSRRLHNDRADSEHFYQISVLPALVEKFLLLVGLQKLDVFLFAKRVQLLLLEHRFVQRDSVVECTQIFQTVC